MALFFFAIIELCYIIFLEGFMYEIKKDLENISLRISNAKEYL